MLNKHTSHDEAFAKWLVYFPPFIIERWGLTPCPNGELCKDNWCDGWIFGLSFEKEMDPRDMEAWTRMVEVGW